MTSLAACSCRRASRCRSETFASQPKLGRIIGVEIDRTLLQPSEKQMVEDLVAAALNDARAKADVAAQEAMRDVTGGLQLPPGFKMPF